MKKLLLLFIFLLVHIAQADTIGDVNEISNKIWLKKAEEAYQKHDYESTIRILRKACLQDNDVAACYAFSYINYDASSSKKPSSYEKEVLKKIRIGFFFACENGFSLGCTIKNIDLDKLDELEKSCVAGDGVSCYYCVIEGLLKSALEDTVIYTTKENIEFLEKSCQSNYASGCLVLGTRIEIGEGVRQNLSLAKEYYGKGCDLGDDAACKKYAELNNP